MIDLLSKKSASGDLCINLARQHLHNHDWGLAKIAVEEGLAKGRLSEPDQAHSLFEDICRRMGVSDVSHGDYRSN